MVNFFRYKRNFNETPFSLVVISQNFLLPLAALDGLLTSSCHNPDRLFQMALHCPYQYSVIFELKVYRTRCIEVHSFRIESVSHATDKGMCDAQIRTIVVGSPMPF